MAKGGESMSLDQFLKTVTPYTSLEIVVLSKDSSHCIEGFKLTILQEMLEKEFSGLENYEIYSIDLVNGFSIAEDGNDKEKVSHIRVIAKEN